MVTKNKKGQAALEFLTTYGWAFLVILVMIGALAYFGVLDPSRFTPSRCQVGIPFSCVGDNYVIDNSDDAFRFRVKNTLNEALTINNIQVRDVSGNWVSCDAFVATVVPIDAENDLVCDLPAAVPAGTVGSKQRIVFQLLYGTAPYEKIIAGEIYATVAP